MIKNFRLYMFNNFLYPDLIRSELDVKQAVGLYSANLYKELNMYLRGLYTPTNKPFMDSIIKDIDKALDLYTDYIKKHKLVKNIHVKRRIYVPLPLLDEFINSIKEGNYNDKAYMSTSLINNYKIPYNVLLDINVSNLLGAYIGGLSRYKNECEFLIKRNIEFDVIDIIENNNLNNKKLIIKLKNK